MPEKRKNVDLTTGVGTLSFPHLFKENASKKDDGTLSYDLQFLIPKSDRTTVKAILAAVAEVAEAKWGADWKSMGIRIPIRDGDKEKNLPTDDGTPRGEKYPERLGHYFINSRSSKPVGIYDRQRNLITEQSEIYAGAKVKVNLSFYPYSNNGNSGVGCGLNGVQKIADGESFGGGRPSVENMFDLLDDDEDLGLDEVAPEPTPAPAAKKTAAKKTAAKKAAPAPEPEPDEDDDLAVLSGDDGDSDLDDMYAELDDLDDSDS